MATTTHTNPVIYDAVETVSRDELATLQLGRLREVVRRRGVDARVDAPDDLRVLPFTTKEDLRAHYPLGMMVVSHDRLVRLHSSSGTSGSPRSSATRSATSTSGPTSWPAASRRPAWAAARSSTTPTATA
jgi:phenylacetate-coenzyme A ligase PaaK-like adenylate-forming protein